MAEKLGTIGYDLGRMLEAFSAMAFVTVVVAVIWHELYAILGRRAVTVTLAALYVALFVLYIAYRGYGPKP